MLKHRLITGFSAAALLLSVLFLLPAWTHFLVILALFVLAQYEFRELACGGGHDYEWTCALALGALLLGATALESPVLISVLDATFPEWNPTPPGRMDVSNFLLAATPGLFLICGVLRRKADHALETAALSFAGFWYVSVLLSFLVRLAFEWPIREDGHTNYTGRLVILLFLLLVKFGDIGGYTIGCLFGKRRLIPEISPKKSVEGLFGEYAFSLFASLLFWAIAFRVSGGFLGDVRFPFRHALILPFLLTSAGVFGDLAESLLKRSVGVKDSSSRFPGMGGLLDMLDSVLFAAPVMYAYVVWFLK